MKKIYLLFIFLSIVSCNSSVDKPKNLISKSDMSEILADIALNEQAIFAFPNKNLESGTLYVLQQHKVSADDFVGSYKYYLVNKSLKDIVDDAKEIVLKRDPKAEKYIQDKLKGEQKELENLPKLEKNLVR